MANAPDYVAIPNTDLDADSPITVALMTALRDNALNAAPVGASISFCGPASEIPVGWLEEDGSAISRSVYADLFTVMGTAFGIGDGSTTFNLPDGRGKSDIGVGTGAGLTARAMADSGGEEVHQLTIAELASHNHSTPYAMGGSGVWKINQSSGSRASVYPVGSTGSNTAHNTMHPYLAKRKIIKAIQ